MSQKSLLKTDNDLAREPCANWADGWEGIQVPEKVRVVLQYLLHLNRYSNQQGFVEGQQSQKDKGQPVQAQYLSFCGSFKTLSKAEQTTFLNLLMEELKNKNSASSLAKGYQLNQQEYSCQMRTKSCCLNQWGNIILRLNKKRKTLRVISQGQPQDFYLREYLLRRSKVHSFCFVLSNFGFAAKGMEYCYHFKFAEKDKEKYEYVEEQIVRLIAQCQAEEIFGKIKQEGKMEERLSKNRGVVRMFLTAKNIGKMAVLARQRQEKQEEQMNFGENDQNGMSFQEAKNDDGVEISVNRKDNTSYKAKYSINNDLQHVFGNFLESYKQSHSMIMGLRILQNHKEKQPSLKQYSAFYQKITWNDKIYGQTLLCLQEGSTASDGFTFLIDNIDHNDNHNFLQYLKLFTVTPSQQTTQIHLQAKFTPSFSKQPDAIFAYLLNFKEVFEGKQLQPQENPSAIYLKISQQFNGKTSILLKQQQKQQQTIKPLSQQTTHLQLLKRDANKDIDNLFSDNFKAKQGQIEIQRVVVSSDYLRTRHYMQASKEKTGRIMNDHFIWKHWKRAEKGGLVCKDQQLVDKQKKMFKLVLKKFGETLLKGKSIMNFSLPVIVFKKESHLESLAKGYLYSPIFTEKAAATSNPLQRMKYSVILMITQNALSIHMQKPFNPILGETFQGYINGCPIYLQQISHHPPISAYFLQGRGYKKYGRMQPKISVGLNSGSGYSLFPHFVEFDDGMKIQYVCAKMLIGGLLIGERTFNFQDKIYSYDRSSKLFSSVSFGPKRRNFFGSNSQPQDYFHGSIYEVSPSFEAYFDAQTGIKPHPQEEHIIRQLATFDGIWNSFVNINGQEVLNFKTDLPYEFQQEKRPLPSDSRYREDLSNLLAGDLEASQAAKEEMEESQRRDQRLREGKKE